MIEAINKLIKVSLRLLWELGREPSIEEIAGAMEIPPEKVSEIIKISQEPLLLEMPVGEEEDSYLGDFMKERDDLSPDSGRSRGQVYILDRRRLTEQQNNDRKSVLTDEYEAYQRSICLIFSIPSNVSRLIGDVSISVVVGREQKSHPANFV